MVNADTCFNLTPRTGFISGGKPATCNSICRALFPLRPVRFLDCVRAITLLPLAKRVASAATSRPVIRPYVCAIQGRTYGVVFLREH